MASTYQKALKVPPNAKMPPLKLSLPDGTRAGMPIARLPPMSSQRSKEPDSSEPSPSHAYLILSSGQLQFHQVEITYLPACLRKSTTPSNGISQGLEGEAAKRLQPKNEYPYGNLSKASYVIVDAHALQNLLEARKPDLTSCMREALVNHDKRRKDYQEFYNKRTPVSHT
jgi:hypothetical protein